VPKSLKFKEMFDSQNAKILETKDDVANCI
jgi:hypothetical protein